MAIKAIIYVRLSGSDDQSSSPQAQEKACRAFCERKGWDVIEVKRDLAESGSDKGKRLLRPSVNEIRAKWGTFDKLVFLRLDRLTRNLFDLLLLQAEAANDNVELWSVSPEANLTDPNVRTNTQINASLAEHEARMVSVRVRESQVYRKEAGKFVGGKPLYGYRKSEKPHPSGAGSILEPDPVAQEIVQEMADRVLAGESRYAIVKSLNDRGITTTNGHAWTIKALNRLLSNESLLGRVFHQGRLLRNDETHLPRQFWDPVISLDTFQRLQPILAPKPVRERKPTARMLSGLAECALCGQKLYLGGSSAVSYTCSARANTQNCDGVAASVVRLEEYVQQRFLDERGHYEVYELRESGKVQQDLTQVKRSIDQTLKAMGEDGAILQVLGEELEALKEQRRQLESAPKAAFTELTPTGVTYADAFVAAESHAERRNLLSRAITRIVVSKGVKGRRGPIDPDRVDIEWAPITLDVPAPKDIDNPKPSRLSLDRMASKLDDLEGPGLISIGAKGAEFKSLRK